MTSTLPPETLGSVSSLFKATLYQEKSYMKHKFLNIISAKRYSPYASATVTATYKWKVHDGKIKIISCRKCRS